MRWLSVVVGKEIGWWPSTEFLQSLCHLKVMYFSAQLKGSFWDMTNYVEISYVHALTSLITYEFFSQDAARLSSMSMLSVLFSSGVSWQCVCFMGMSALQRFSRRVKWLVKFLQIFMKLWSVTMCYFSFFFCGDRNETGDTVNTKICLFL